MSQSASKLSNSLPAGHAAVTDSVDPVFPLRWFYNQAEKRLPAVEELDSEALPQPYRDLLFHDRDMTSTLKRFHRAERIWVQALARERQGDLYHRLVVLRITSPSPSGSDSTSDDQDPACGRPVEFGAIRIHLDRFPALARDWILEESKPLGRILLDAKIAYVSRPERFFKTVTDNWIGSALQMEEGQVVYGRCNVLWDGNSPGLALAEIVEILPLS